MDLVSDLKQAVVRGDMAQAREITEKALKGGADPKVLLDDALISGMDHVGELFKANEVYVPEVLLSAKSMQQAMQVLKPYLVKGGIKPRGTVVVGTVRGDLHDIGKNLVAMMLEGAGFEVVDLGNDVPPERFVDAAVEHKASLIGMSALLTTTMYSMKETIDLLRKRQSANSIKTMIGGAPVTAAFAREIGADGYGPDAATAVDLAKQFIGSN
ncbi:MAG TPA: corrinoid protein [bacterium]|nr:corrinoid protein [bacterium]